jgi:succinate---hydroxymethylglutarate CoA-transferase
MRVELDHPAAGRISVVGVPWSVEGFHAEIRLPPPVLGQHTREVLGELGGYSETQIDELATNGDVQLSEARLRTKT